MASSKNDHARANIAGLTYLEGAGRKNGWSVVRFKRGSLYRAVGTDRGKGER
jgi:hypothetical protein